MQHFNVYLQAHRFQLQCDHKALSFLTKAISPNARLQRWALILSAYQFDVKYVPGRRMGHADSLSRIEDSDYEKALAILTSEYHKGHINTVDKTDQTSDTDNEDNVNDTLEEYCLAITEFPTARRGVRLLQETEPWMLAMMNYLHDGTTPDDLPENLLHWVRKHSRDYLLSQGLLFKFDPVSDRRPRLVVPPSMKDTIIFDAHSGKFGGHFGFEKTWKKIALYYYWPELKQDVSKFCQACLSCAKNKLQTRKPHCKLQPLPIPQRPMEVIEMDLVGPLKTSAHGNRYLLVITCLLTKYPECVPLPDKSARTVATAFFDHFLCRYLCPRVIATDCGTEFTAQLTTELLSKLGVAHRLSTAFLHSSVGQVERVNGTLITSLRHYVNSSQDDWCQHIGKVLMAYRSSVHATTAETPHYMLYGWDPAPLTEQFLHTEDSVYAETPSFASYHAQAMRIAWQVARLHTQDAQQKMRHQHNKRSFEPSIQMGDKVFINQPAQVKGQCRKLAPQFAGPFRVIQFDGGQNIVIRPMNDPDKPPYICHRNRVKTFRDEWPSTPLRHITAKYSSIPTDFKIEQNNQLSTTNAVPRDVMEEIDSTPIPLPDANDLCNSDSRNSHNNAPSHRYFLRSTV